MKTAAITNPALGPTLQGWLGGDNAGQTFFSTLIPNAVTLALVGASVLFFFMLVWGAISWISSGGDKGAVETARGRVTSAIVGIVILFAVFAIIKIIEQFFGVSILTLDLGTLKIQ